MTRRASGMALLFVLAAMAVGCGGAEKPEDEGLRSVVGASRACGELETTSQGRNEAGVELAMLDEGW